MCAVSVFAIGVAGCTGASASLDLPKPPPTKVTIAVEGDPGTPVTGARISRNDKVVAATGADGHASLTLDGADGETVDAQILCPDGFTSPIKPLTMRIARNHDGRPPVFNVSCPPALRHVVVAVRTENGANLPVLYLGKVIAHTDESGAAHLALVAAPGEQFQVTIDTSGDSDKLTPASPMRPFTVGNTDDIFVFDQKFVRPKKVVAARPKPHVATAIHGKNS